MEENTKEFNSICLSCGNELNKDALFCGKCGAKNSKTILPTSESTISDYPNSSNWLTILPALKLWILLLASNGVIGLIIFFLKKAPLSLTLTLTIIDIIIIMGFILFSKNNVFSSFKNIHYTKNYLIEIVIAIISIAFFIKVYFFLLGFIGIETIGYLDEYRKQDWPIWSAFIMIAVLPAIFEEITFRGFIMERLLKVGGKKEALIIQAIMFSVLHMLPTMFISHFFIGIVLGLLYQKTKSIYPSMIVHFLWNSIVLVEEIYRYSY